MSVNLAQRWAGCPNVIQKFTRSVNQDYTWWDSRVGELEMQPVIVYTHTAQPPIVASRNTRSVQCTV